MNPHKGEAELVVGDKTYTLRYSHSALVKLENLMNKGLAQILREMSNLEQQRLGTIVAILWAGLQKHHPKMSFEDAADLLDEIEGGASGVMPIIDQAFARAFNAPGTKGTNPLQAGNGTGTSNSLNTPVTVTTPMPSGMSRPEN